MNTMKRIHLIHWNEIEAQERADRLRGLGYDVDYGMPNAAAIRALKENTPDVFIIDLSRLPSQGRDMGLVIRQSRVLRAVPIVFAGGQEDKIEMVKKFLPDAVYSAWADIRLALKSAIANPPSNPVVPRSALDGYAGAPLTKKLGLKPGCRVTLIDTPAGFKSLVGALPGGAKYVSRRSGAGDLIIWFAKTMVKLEREIGKIRMCMAPKAGLWICWPKKTSGVESDLSEKAVRRIGLASGLVDYKVCAIDETWSGLKFTRRKK